MLRIESLWQKIGTQCGFYVEDKNITPLKVNRSLLHYNPSLDPNDDKIVLVKRCEESERVEALPPSLRSSSEDGSRLESIEDFRYPWKDLDEPKDIERILDVTALDICAYSKFINSIVSEEERKQVYNRFNNHNYLALTYNKDYNYKPIKLLFVSYIQFASFGFTYNYFRKKISLIGNLYCFIYKNFDNVSLLCLLKK